MALNPHQFFTRRSPSPDQNPKSERLLVAVTIFNAVWWAKQSTAYQLDMAFQIYSLLFVESLGE
jgi:hypothetical protein